MEQARGADDDIERARALFAASQIARQHGMELLGTENAPDWSIVDGSYDLATYADARRYLVRASERPAHRDEPPPANPLPTELRDALLTTGEASRVSAHVPPHAQRFHYRETAADLAEAAARLVPQRSQAYYAMMCAAAKYLYFTNPKRMEQLWLEYVRHGALISDKTSVFGETCPPPELERARTMARAWHWPKLRKRAYAMIAAPMVGLGFAITLLVIRRKRRRPPPTTAAPEPSSGP
jgi:hypothetical protein